MLSLVSFRTCAGVAVAVALAAFAQIGAQARADSGANSSRDGAGAKGSEKDDSKDNAGDKGITDDRVANSCELKSRQPCLPGCKWDRAQERCITKEDRGN